MELYKDKYVTFSYDENTKTMKEVWTAETEQMEAKDLKELMLKLVSFFEKYPSIKYYSYAVDFKFGVSVEMQTWIDEKVTPVAIKSGIKKIARIMSNDFISQLSLEQFSEEAKVSLIQNKFFDNIEEAENWLG